MSQNDDALFDLVRKAIKETSGPHGGLSLSGVGKAAGAFKTQHLGALLRYKAIIGAIIDAVLAREGPAADPDTEGRGP